MGANEHEESVETRYFCPICRAESAAATQCERCKVQLKQCGWCEQCGGYYRIEVEQQCPTHGTTLVNRIVPKAQLAALASKKPNYFATASLICAIVSIFVSGSATSVDQWQFFVGSGLVGIVAILLGITGVSRAKKLRSGRGIAIAGIVVGTLSAFQILMPVVDTARQAAMQSAAKGLVGLPVPPFTLKRSDDGASVSSTSLSGSVYLLDFGPSPDSLLKLDAFAKKYKGDGFMAFAVVSESAANGASAFARANRLDIPILPADETGDVAEAFHARYNAETVLVGRDGYVLGVFFGATYTGEIEDAVKSALTTK